MPLLINTSCKKTVISSPLPVSEELPPATQEGKNTCGFLVNGKVWLPKGRVGNGEPNLKWWYDPAYHNGTFNINGYRYEKPGDANFTSFVIGVSNVNTIGLHKLNNDDSGIGGYSDYYKNCIYYREDTIRGHDSWVNVQKFDLQNRIIAGTFHFSLYKSGCDTVHITDGRFDIKL